MFAPLKEHGMELLKYDPEFVIDRIGIVTPEGDGYIKGVITLKGATAEDFAGGSMALIGKIDADITIDVSREDGPEIPERLDGRGRGWSTRATPSARATGWSARSCSPRAQLTVNGKPQAIPGLGGPPAGSTVRGSSAAAGVESAPRMASLKDISVVVEGVVTESRAIRSGEKYVTPQGFTAIKDGQKQRAATSSPPATRPQAARGSARRCRWAPASAR